MRNGGVAKRDASQKMQKINGSDHARHVPVSDIEGALRREIQQRRIAEGVAHSQAEAISRTLELLVREPALPDFMRAILRAINGQCGGVWTTLWLIDERSGAGFRRWSRSRDEETGRAVEVFADRHKTLMGRLSVLYRESLRDGVTKISVAADDPRLPVRMRSFYRRMGVRAAVVVGLMLGRQLLGWISHLSSESKMGPEQVAFLESMAKQAALAVQVTRIADIQHDAECAREGEQHALEQGREVIEINRLLRINAHESGDRIGAVLRGVLDNTTELLHGNWACLWRAGESLGLVQPVWMRGSTASEHVPAERSERLARECGVSHGARIERWLSGEEIVDEPAAGKRAAKFLEAIGVSSAKKTTRLVSVPLIFDGDSQGFILVLTDNLPDPLSERWMAAKALGMQAALALSLDDLSSIQRSAALAEERNRIARDLHDLLAQSFAGIALQVEAMHAVCPVLPAPVAERLEKIRTQATRSTDELRRTLQMLRPTALDQCSLPEALSMLARSTESRSGVRVQFSDRAGSLKLAPRVEQHLFAIVSEALQNALSHASPRRISITMTIARERLVLRVCNDGGVALGDLKPSFDGRRHGLSNIRDRASEIGGTFTLRTRQRQTQLEMLVPLERLAGVT
jgi:signal transduction histidine kinase